MERQTPVPALLIPASHFHLNDPSAFSINMADDRSRSRSRSRSPDNRNGDSDGGDGGGGGNNVYMPPQSSSGHDDHNNSNGDDNNGHHGGGGGGGEDSGNPNEVKLYIGNLDYGTFQYIINSSSFCCHIIRCGIFFLSLLFSHILKK
jgi:hypothetical protein